MVGWGDKVGKYLLKEKLGQGGMGVVYLAVQEGLEREVALKILPEEGLVRSRDLLKRFVKEVSVCARLSHPNIIKIFDYGFEQGVYYYAMEVLRATSLEKLMIETPLQPIDFTLRIAREMASAMGHYHPMSIVHRDIKPANIMLDESGNSILTDFGLVKDLEATGITRHGAAVGTPYYMAPEQIRAEMVDGASDIYQLGVVLYRMLAGRLPFEGTTPAEVFSRALHAEAPAISTLNPLVPVPLESVVLNCLEKSREVRYARADELAADLALAARRAPVVRRRDGSVAPPGSRVAAAGRVSAVPKAATTALGAGAQTTGSIRTAPRPSAIAPAARSPWPGRTIRMLALLLSLPAAFGIVWIRTRPTGPPAHEMKVRVGVRSAVVEWQSPWAYTGRVEWGPRGQAPFSTDETGEPGRVHSASIGPLTPGGSYVYRVVAPEGARSLEYAFDVPGAPLTPSGLIVGDKKLTLAFRTPHEAAVTAAGPWGRRVEPAPALEHQLELGPLDPLSDAVDLSFADGAGEAVRLSRADWLALFAAALTERTAAELSRTLGAYDPGPFLSRSIDRVLPAHVISGATSLIERVGISDILAGKPQGRMPYYQAFRPGEPAARELAGVIRRELEGQPFMAAIRALRLLAPSLAAGRRLPPEGAFRVASELGKLLAIDYSAGFVAIPFSSGVESLLGGDLKPSAQSRLTTSAYAIQYKIPASGHWGYPMTEFDILHKEGWDRSTIIPIGSHVWKLSLEDPSRWNRVEFSLLGMRLESELYFRVTINRVLTLCFFKDPVAAIRDSTQTFPIQAMTFDPRVLRSGVNEILVEIAPVPGTRYLGLKRFNRLTGLKIAWE